MRRCFERARIGEHPHVLVDVVAREPRRVEGCPQLLGGPEHLVLAVVLERLDVLGALGLVGRRIAQGVVRTPPGAAPTRSSAIQAVRVPTGDVPRHDRPPVVADEVEPASPEVIRDGEDVADQRPLVVVLDALGRAPGE